MIKQREKEKVDLDQPQSKNNINILTFYLLNIKNMIFLRDDVAYLSEDHDFSGAKAFLFTLITCGIYSLFWAYKLGKDIQIAQEKHNIPATDNSTLYVILNLIGLSIVTYCLAQNEVNNMAQN